VAFAVVLGVTLVAAFWVVHPFAAPALLGAFTAVLFMPAHGVLARRLGRTGPLAAGLTTLGVFLLVVLPLAGIAALVVREAMGAAAKLQEMLEAGALPAALTRLLPGSRWLPEAQGGVLTALEAAAGFLSRLVGQGARWGGSCSRCWSASTTSSWAAGAWPRRCWGSCPWTRATRRALPRSSGASRTRWRGVSDSPRWSRRCWAPRACWLPAYRPRCWRAWPWG